MHPDAGAIASIRAYLISHGLSQREFSRRTGLTQTKIQRILCGQRVRLTMEEVRSLTLVVEITGASLNAMMHPDDPLPPPRNIAGQVVRGPDLWGRQAELAEIWRRLERGSVLLAAPRRYGKSSMMYALQTAPRQGWAVVYVNVEAVVDPAEFAVELLVRILADGVGIPFLERVRRTLDARLEWPTDVKEDSLLKPDIIRIRRLLRTAPPDDVRGALELVVGDLLEPGLKTLLILDGFPEMVTTMLARGADEAVRFLRWFRALRQKGGHFLISGVADIESGLGQAGLLDDFEVVRLLPFSREKAVTFVRALLAAEDEVVAPPDLPERLVDLQGTGVPFFLQVFVAELMGEARRRACRPTPALAEEVLRDTVLGARCAPMFDHLRWRLREYGGAERAAREVLDELANGNAMTLQRFTERAHAAEIDPARLLARLEGDCYVARHGEMLQFSDRFLAEWWRRNASAPALGVPPARRQETPMRGSTGVRIAGPRRARRGGRSLLQGGLRVLFALLAEPLAIDAPYRELARLAGVALGTVANTFAQLKEQGHVLPNAAGRLSIADRAQLLGRWQLGYAEILRGTLLLGRARPVGGVTVQATLERARDVPGLLVGGEVAGALLTRHLVPERGAVHTREPVGSVLSRLRLVPDAEGPIDLFRRFGEADAGPIMDGMALVHPLLLRAELLAHGDTRLSEVARMISEQSRDS